MVLCCFVFNKTGSSTANINLGEMWLIWNVRKHLLVQHSGGEARIIYYGRSLYLNRCGSPVGNRPSLCLLHSHTLLKNWQNCYQIIYLKKHCKIANGCTKYISWCCQVVKRLLYRYIPQFVFCQDWSFFLQIWSFVTSWVIFLTNSFLSQFELSQF